MRLLQESPRSYVIINPMKDALAIASLVLSLAVSMLYIIQVVRGKVKPQRFSWLLWTMLSATYFASALSTGGGVLFTFGELVGPGLIFLVSLKYGVGGKSRFDLVSLVIALVAFVLLFVASNVLFGLILALVVDGIGFMLTARKLAKDRSSEQKMPWLLYSLGGLLAIFGLQTFSVENLLFPIYIVISCGVFFFMADPKAKPKPEAIENL